MLKRKTKKLIKKIIIASLIFFTISAIAENKDRIISSFSKIKEAVPTVNKKSKDTEEDGIDKLMQLYLEYEKNNTESVNGE